MNNLTRVRFSYREGDLNLLAKEIVNLSTCGLKNYAVKSVDKLGQTFTYQLSTDVVEEYDEVLSVLKNFELEFPVRIESLRGNGVIIDGR